jgi:hydrogenase nickel incorporation protein HypA/HybF
VHEAALAKRLLDVVLARAAAEGATCVRSVRGRVAEDEVLSAESLRFHFAAHARGTAAEGARLDLTLVHLEARCRACGTSYLPAHHLRLCPGCGSTDGELCGEPGLRLEALEVEDA